MSSASSSVSICRLSLAVAAQRFHERQLSPVCIDESVRCSHTQVQGTVPLWLFLHLLTCSAVCACLLCERGSKSACGYEQLLPRSFISLQFSVICSFVGVNISAMPSVPVPWFPMAIPPCVTALAVVLTCACVRVCMCECACVACSASLHPTSLSIFVTFRGPQKLVLVTFHMRGSRSFQQILPPLGAAAIVLC